MHLLLFFSFTCLPNPNHRCSFFILAAFRSSRCHFAAFICITATQLGVPPHLLRILQSLRRIGDPEQQNDEDSRGTRRRRGRIRNKVVHWYLKGIGQILHSILQNLWRVVCIWWKNVCRSTGNGRRGQIRGEVMGWYMDGIAHLVAELVRLLALVTDAIRRKLFQSY